MLVLDSRNRWWNAVRRYTLWLLVSASVVGITGCANHMVTGAVEKRIADRLPDLIGPASSYKVEVHGSAGKVMRGRIKEVVVHGKDVRAMPDLTLDALDVQMKDVVADTKSSKLQSVGQVTFQAIISEGSLNDYLARTRSDGTQVKLLAGEMVVTTRPALWRLSTNVKLMGSLIARGGKLDMQIDRFEVAGINAPSIAKKALEDKMNPVLDLSRMAFSPELASATIMPGEARITGTINLAGGL